MKKVYLLLFVISMVIVTLSVNANGSFSDEFIDNLVSCRKYKEEIPFGFITPTLVVKGWVNGKCVYENYPKESPESKYTCRFSKSQLREISIASRKDQTKKETLKLNGITYTADPLSLIFTKYMGDSSTCTMPKK